MPLYKFVVLTIDTANVTAFEVIKLSNEAADIMSLAVAEVIKKNHSKWGSCSVLTAGVHCNKEFMVKL